MFPICALYWAMVLVKRRDGLSLLSIKFRSRFFSERLSETMDLEDFSERVGDFYGVLAFLPGLF